MMPVSLGTISASFISKSTAFNSLFTDSKLLLQLILTYPITSNEAERSFSQLKRLLTSQRTTMTHKRVNNLMLMAAHRTHLNDISNDDVMKKFNEKPR